MYYLTVLPPQFVLPLNYIYKFRNINLIPFQYIIQQRLLDRFTELTYTLGPTNPWSSAARKETFSTSVFKV